jgi:peptidoglycan/LPS O-acetylase OafA/YrhL
MAVAHTNTSRAELQSLRGIAAALVMVHHSLRTIDASESITFISEVVLNAHAAVMLFFVLSGYVLTLSLESRDDTFSEIISFYIRRVARIYPALWVGVTLGILYLFTLRELPVSAPSSWFEAMYDVSHFTLAKAIAAYAGMANLPLPVLWTIQVELAASILIPFLVLAQSRRSWAPLALVLALSLISFISGERARYVPLYLVSFAVGGALCPVMRLGIAFPRAVEVSIAAASAVLLLYFRQLQDWTYHASVPALVEAIASALLIRSVCIGLLPWLRHARLCRLGDLSYSIYLLHVPVAFSLTSLFAQTMQSWPSTLLVVFIASSTFLITYVLSALTYAYIELPGIAFGKRLSDQYMARWRRDKLVSVRLEGKRSTQGGR